MASLYKKYKTFLMNVGSHRELLSMLRRVINSAGVKYCEYDENWTFGVTSAFEVGAFGMGER